MIEIMSFIIVRRTTLFRSQQQSELNIRRQMKSISVKQIKFISITATRNVMSQINGRFFFFLTNNCEQHTPI